MTMFIGVSTDIETLRKRHRLRCDELKEQGET